MISDTKIEAIIFDLDGTIYDKKGIKYFFIYSFFFKLKLLLAFLKIRKNIEGIDFGTQTDFNNKYIEELAKKTSKSKAVCQNFVDDFMYRFVEVLRKKYKAYDEVVETINFYHKKGIRLVCLSDYTLVKERLIALGVDPNKFTLLKSSEEYGALKPHSKSFLGIADALKIAPSNILVVGDRDDTDGEGARKSNMHFIKYPENFKRIKEFAYNEKS